MIFYGHEIEGEDDLENLGELFHGRWWGYDAETALDFEGDGDEQVEY